MQNGNWSGKTFSLSSTTMVEYLPTEVHLKLKNPASPRDLFTASKLLTGDS
jgi:hypothetical protein